MLDIIPYIPQNTPGVKQELWKVALQAWRQTLIKLLDMPDHDFISETSSNTSLALLVETLLSEHIDNPQASDKQLIKSIFLVYVRLASLDSTESLLLDNGSKFCQLAVVYGESNPLQIRRMMQQLSTHDTIESVLLSTLTMLVDIFQDLPNALSVPASLDALHRAYVLLRLLDALFLSTATCQSIQHAMDELDQTLIDCYQHLIPLLKKTVEHEPATAPLAYLIKQTIVSIFNSYVDIRFFMALGYTSDLQAHDQLKKLDSPVDDTILDIWSQKMLHYIEQSGLDSSRYAFVDGPLIMDWQVEYHVSEKLNHINQQQFGGEEDRLAFLSLSMEQVRDTNEGTGSWGDSLIEQQETQSEDDDDEWQLLATKISELHDLFPHLDDRLLETYLRANNFDMEAVVTQVLEGTSSDDTPSGSVLASRHNIYDNDEFDVFARRTLDTSRVFAGKKDKGTADSLLDDKEFIQSEKANVLQRVVDMYDDDYDDTYDDIHDGGVPGDMDGDSALDVVKKRQQVDDPGVFHESILVHAFVETPSVFDRNREGRKSKARIELKKKTGMSDEQIEGWAIMLKRNPRKQRILDKYMLYNGQQTSLPNESDNKKPVEQKKLTEQKKSTEQSKPTEQKKDSRSFGNKKDNTRSPAPETKKETNKDENSNDARDKAYKNKNKARFGNHNRKAQRDRKMAKAGPPPA